MVRVMTLGPYAPRRTWELNTRYVYITSNINAQEDKLDR